MEEKALHLLCETFRRSRVKVTLLDASASLFDFLRTSFPFSYPEAALEGAPGLLGTPKADTLYRLKSEGVFHARYLLLPDGRTLFIGPYLTKSLSPDEVFSLGERRSISPQAQRSLAEFCAGLAILLEDNPLFSLLDSFCEQIFESHAFAIRDADELLSAPPPGTKQSAPGDGSEDLLLNMKAMERRYAYENELMEAVTLGQLHKERLLTPLFATRFFERRVADPLRNAKNYHIIMNTLLRKAAERAGVHPLYLDETSSGFAREIEALSSVDGSADLMRRMFRSYCRLVRKNSIRQYSRIVQQTILAIDADLSAPLSPSSLAAAQGVSAPYLSTVFRRETGKTLSSYLRDKRMEQAAELLATTHLQVQSVALHCGILDVQYFSKLFRRQFGCTPKEYRERTKQTKKP